MLKKFYTEKCGYVAQQTEDFGESHPRASASLKHECNFTVYSKSLIQQTNNEAQIKTIADVSMTKLKK